MRLLKLFLFVFLTFPSCEQEDQRDFKYDINYASLVSTAKPLADVTDDRLAEVSGMVVSRKNPGYLWVHNDSGDDPNLYLIDLETNIVMTAHLQGIEAVDWEDLAWRDHNGISQLIIGDIGDNGGIRDKVSLHIIDEPVFEGIDHVEIPKSEIRTVTLQYKEGSRDAEALCYNHLSGKAVIVTKREKRSLIYEFDIDQSDQLLLKSTGNIDLRNFTSADINQLGQLVLKNYNAVFYWSVDSFDVADKISKTSPVRLPYYAEPQGETIAWDSLGGYYTLTEHNINAPQILFYYPPKDH